MRIAQSIQNFFDRLHMRGTSLVAAHSSPSDETTPPRSYYVHALLDTETNATLTLGSFSPTLVFLNACMADTSIAWNVHYPSSDAAYALMAGDRERLPESVWNPRTRNFTAANKVILTESLRARAKLASAKLRVIEQVMRALSNARQKIATGIEFQETIYLTKRAQAQAFKDANYNENDLLAFPYIVQYADLAKMSLRAAADEILFKASLDDQFLASTEFIRLKYFRLIRDATQPEELKQIEEQFVRDMFVNTHFN